MRKLLYLLSILVLFSSCGWINSSIMLKTDKHYQYSKNPDSTNTTEYKLSPNDILDIRMYSNDGFKLIDLTSLNESAVGYKITSAINYPIDAEGNVKLPILGKRRLAGLTAREAQLFLEESYASFYNKPYVFVQILNRRVIVFPGAPGDARVIPIENNNLTLIEAIALAGGLSENGKARMVKLIRQKNSKQEVYLMDLSTIKGLKDANTVLQSNDIIYVEPRRKYASKVLQELAPIVSLVTSVFILITYSTLIANKL